MVASLAAALVALMAACSNTIEPEVEVLAAQAVDSRYIVVLDPEFAPDGHAANKARAAEIARSLGLSPLHTYGTALFGFSAVVPEERLGALKRDPRVAYVEADQLAHIFSQEVPTGISRIYAANNSTININGVDDRVDVDVAVIDTGVQLDHPDLHVVASTDCSGGSPFRGSCTDGAGEDDNGHGTHVAGTIGALDNDIGVVGVAPGARLWSVKVLRSDGSGYMSWIIAGVDYVTAHAEQIEVANMSLGCKCQSDALDEAITNSVAAGIVYVVAAGNSNEDAKDFSPASHEDVITVSALADFDGKPGGEGQPTCRDDEDDTLANFSNWGEAVDIAAPGVCINSTWLDSGYLTASGTSMAAPHVAGAAAILASQDAPGGKGGVDAIKNTIIDQANDSWEDADKDKRLGDDKYHRILDVGDEETFAPLLVSGEGEPAPEGPTADFTYECDELSCTFDASSSTGSIETWQWDFGDDNGGSGEKISHKYADDGTYTVTLTVTDDNDLENTTENDVTVSSSGDADSDTDIALSATGYKVRGLQKVDLTWSGATSDMVDIWWDGNGEEVVATTANDGEYTHDIDRRGGGAYTYWLCEEDSGACSDEVTVTF